MNKKSWKRKSLGRDEIRTALRTSRSLTAAARALGVNRSTLHRWIEADPSLKAARQLKAVATEQALQNAEIEPDQWAENIRRAYELTPTEQVLVTLADRALKLANDDTAKPNEQLAAMARFQRLVQQLDLEEPEDGKAAPHQLYSV